MPRGAAPPAFPGKRPLTQGLRGPVKPIDAAAREFLVDELPLEPHQMLKGDFLADYPVPFPHFKDPDLEVAASFNGVQAFPTTAFYDPRGDLAFVHQGGYASEADLAEDIDKYAR